MRRKRSPSGEMRPCDGFNTEGNPSRLPQQVPQQDQRTGRLRYVGAEYQSSSASATVDWVVWGLTRPRLQLRSTSPLIHCGSLEGLRLVFNLNCMSIAHVGVYRRMHAACTSSRIVVSGCNDAPVPDRKSASARPASQPNTVIGGFSDCGFPFTILGAHWRLLIRRDKALPSAYDLVCPPPSTRLAPRSRGRGACLRETPRRDEVR